LVDHSNFIKLHGRLEQRQKGFFAVRIRTRAGNLNSDQWRKVADLADKYGRGQLHITTRQSVELHWVPESQLDTILQEIHDMDLLTAVRGARVMTTIACPGVTLCKRGICDTITLATQLDNLVVGREQSGRTKIAVSGCPNSCAKPQINDIGLHGVIIPTVADGCIGCNACVKGCKVKAIEVNECIQIIDTVKCVGCGLCVKNCPEQALIAKTEGYAVYAGGKIGKKPMLGVKMFVVVPEQKAISYVEAILAVYNRLSNKGERIGSAMERLGVETFRQEIIKQVVSNEDYPSSQK
jgi:dissimilatory sulfite reductase (desulfoviridin) alpha/beta subunit